MKRWMCRKSGWKGECAEKVFPSTAQNACENCHSAFISFHFISFNASWNSTTLIRKMFIYPGLPEQIRNCCANLQYYTAHSRFPIAKEFTHRIQIITSCHTCSCSSITHYQHFFGYLVFYLRDTFLLAS